MLAVLPHVDAVKVPGAHTLTFSAPELIAELIEAHLADAPLTSPTGVRREVEILDVGQPMSPAFSSTRPPTTGSSTSSA